MKGSIYKVLGLLLVAYSLIYGLLTKVPDLPIIEESIRNLFYHVSMWFAMVAMMAASFWNAIRFLGTEDLAKDRRSVSLAEMGMFFSFMGLFTGMVWAKFTWGAWWTNDPKLNGTAITILIYLAYLWLSFDRLRIVERREAWMLGALWLLLTVAFEFGFGHYVVGHPWRRLFADYELLAGRVWLLFLICVLLGPRVVLRLRGS